MRRIYFLIVAGVLVLVTSRSNSADSFTVPSASLSLENTSLAFTRLSFGPFPYLTYIEILPNDNLHLVCDGKEVGGEAEAIVGLKKMMRGENPCSKK